jgi:hypothetical protein
MHRLLASSLGLSLGLWAGAAAAQESAYPAPRVCEIITLVEEETPATGYEAQVWTWVESPAPIIRAQSEDEPEVVAGLAKDAPVVLPAPASCGTGLCPADDQEYYCCYETCCGCGNRFFAGADFLCWWLQDGAAPPLLTTGPAAVFPPGALGAPGTTVLADGRGLTDNPFLGGRFYAGYWLDSNECLGLEARGFFLAERTTGYVAGSDAYPVLSRPFFDVLNNRQFVESIALPDRFVGAFSLAAPTRLWGLEANLRRNACCGCGGWIDLLAGFRYLDLDEGLQAFEVTSAISGPLAGETRIGFDSLDTDNRFYGGQLGAVAEARFGQLSCQLRGTLALGCTQQSVTIHGAQAVLRPGAGPEVHPGNLLALPTNMGVWSTNRFAVVPEIGVNFGYQLTEHLRFNVGYTLLYWSSVLRPGDQVDLNINPSQIPNFGLEPFRGPVAPTVPLDDRGIWAQGVNLGVEFRW